MEPRLVIFRDTTNKECTQGYIVAEQKVIFEMDGFTIVEGFVALIASYYSFFISYLMKSTIAAMELLFIQEALLNDDDIYCKKTVRYNSLISSITD